MYTVQYQRTSVLTLFIAALLFLFNSLSAAADTSGVDGDYTLHVYRVWNDDHAPNRSDPFYYPGKTEILYTAQFSILAAEPRIEGVTDHTNSNARAMHDLLVSVRQDETLRISGSINTLIKVPAPGSFSADFMVTNTDTSVITTRERGLSPSYLLRVDLTRRVSPLAQGRVQQAQARRQPSASDFQRGFTTESQGSPRSGTTGPADRVRLAQSILAAMGLYTSSIDGVAGPGTNRALNEAMQQLNSTASPNVENFLALAIDRIRAIEQPNSPANSAADANEILANSTDLSNRLQTTSEELLSVKAQLDQVKQELETERLAAANAATGADNETIATLELQVAELTAQLERTQAGVRGTDALNATIADLSEELVVLRPLPSQIVVLEAENDGLQRQLSAANVTVADLREGIAADERVGELQRQLNAANATIADLSERAASAEDLNALLQRQLGDLNQSFAELRNNAQSQVRQLSAANETIAELRERMNTAFVPATEHAELQRQLSAAVATNTELRETIRSNYVSRADFLDAQRVLAAANESMADIRRAIETEFMPLEDYNRLERQVAALNSTILEIQDRNEIQRNRMIESEAMFRNFRDDCAAVPECARAMRLE